MRIRTLSLTLAYLKRVLADPELESGHREVLTKALRELEVVRRSGKLDRRRVFRAVEMISATLLEMSQERQASVR